jgi:hypothetical protein
VVGNHLQPRWPSNTSVARASRPCIFTGGTPMHPDKSNRDRWGQTAHATAGRRHAKLRACPRRPRPRRQRGWPLATPEWLREAVMPSSNTVMGVFQFDFSAFTNPRHNNCAMATRRLLIAETGEPRCGGQKFLLHSGW